MRLAQPPGIRSCQRGGTWDKARSQGGTHRLYTDLARFLDRLPDSEKAILRADIASKMERAKNGNLVFRTADGPADVDLIASARFVLEIRVVDHAEPDGANELQPRHTRVYFTEPEHLPGCLLLLGIASKCPGPEGLVEQDQHAATAARIADEHCAR